MLKNKIFSTLVSMFVGITCLAGCTTSTSNSSSNKNNSNNATKYKVSYYVDGTQYGETEEYESGSKLTKPTDPVKAQDEDFTYDFNGWYLNGADDAWDFETDVITSNMELFAEFDETAIEYDLSVWVYAGTTSTEDNTYITEEEYKRVKDEAAKAFEGKKVLVKYHSGMNNDAFNAKVLSTSRTPDVVISGAKMNSGENPLTLNETYTKASVGQGWFTNTSRYVGVLSTCVDNLDNATAFYNKMVGQGPDYFTFGYESLTLRVAQPYTLTPTLAEGDTRTVTYSSLDEEIATVETDGRVNTLVEGKTTIRANLGLVTMDISLTVIANHYDLVVFVYGSNAAKEQSIYITAEENEYYKEQVTTSADFADKSIYWEYVEDKANDDFNMLVLDNIAQGFIVDLVVSGNNMNSSKTEAPIPLDATYGKVNAGEGWFENTSRKVAVTEACDENKELAIKAYTMLSNASPKYKGVAIEETNETVYVGDTLELHATAYGTVTWTSSDETKATVENGVVTALAEGEVTITATALDGGTDTCVITIEAKPVVEKTYKLVVYVYGATSKSTYITEDESNAIKAAFLTASGLTEEDVLWEYVVGKGNSDFNLDVNTAITDGTIVDVVISGNNMDKSDQNPIALDATNGKAAVGSGWFENTSRKVAITDACDANMERAIVLYNLLTAAKA